MKDTEYAYAVAYTKTLENRMLTKSDIEMLINAKSFAEAIKLLNDKGYGKKSNMEDLEGVLKDELEKTWKEVLDATPEEAPLDILKYKNDFHNLKTILKAFITGAEWKDLMLEPSILEPEELYEAIKSADFSLLPEFLKEAAQNGYRIVTLEHDGQALEIYIDKMTYEAMKKRAEGNEFLLHWIDLNIFFADILIALRTKGKSLEFIKRAMIPTDSLDLDELSKASLLGEEAIADILQNHGYKDAVEELSKSYGDFEKWCDNKKMEILKQEKNKFFGFEPIMAFLLGKEAEIQAVRIILSGHKTGIPSEIIRERLRDLYV